MKKVLNIIKWPWKKFKNLSLKKKIIIIVAVIIILTILNSTIFTSKESGYVTEPVSRETISQTVSETGNVEAGSSIAITSPATGTITEVYVANGQQVNEGTTLFTVKSAASVQEQQTAYANYLGSVTALNATQAQNETLRASMYAAWDEFYNLSTGDTYKTEGSELKEDERLSAEFQISQDTWLAAEKRFKDQQTAIAQGQAQVSSTWLAYQATQNAEVKATITGTVANLSISKGSDITATTENALMLTTSTEDKYVVVSVSEIDVPKIKNGQKAEVEIDAIDDTLFSGEVARVDTVGTNTQGVITYKVYIKLLENNPAILSGMTASAEIATNTVENALAVPNTALKPYQGGRAVQILENGQPKFIPVRIGIRGNERTQILEGVSENQEIIIGARNELIQREGSFEF